MSWRETWRETVDSFLREVRGGEGARPGQADDPLLAAIGGARREIAALEQELELADARAERERSLADDCARRREQARRIGDGETAAIADRFGSRHRDRADVLMRKRRVLCEELELARAALNDLLDLVRVEPGPG